ncbi:diguanylate cyclase [uncultured Oxalicibacterium sp.]|uniref:GGDEF domain-containing protein n=1 Tax=uncultured Oxalicibacterium sp. TaxID=1168540 RepID=UPI0025D567CD|nr:sensor domain-containing diguanylate cyclase [uncultured Oxalicibacterium sp.]
MSSHLAEENARLQRQLSELLEQARRNQDIMQRYQAFDLKFIGANSFQELIDSVFDTLTEASELDVVTLALIDPEHEIRRILSDLRIDISDYPNLLFIEDNSDDTALPSRKPMLGAYNPLLHRRLFPDAVLKPASVAILPLIRRNTLIGWLSLGSLDAQRFTVHMASDFLQHRASIVAICVENVINNERLQHIGLTDPLTGVNNRRYVEKRLLEEVGRTQRHGYPLSCMYIDLDHFKAVNDRYGHQGGDEVLREVAKRIQNELRLSDALGRFGGEEFVVLLIDAPHAVAMAVAERIRHSVDGKSLLLSSGETVHATVSIGVATAAQLERRDAPLPIAQALLSRADTALYRAKKAGRNRVISGDE